ncbi:gamma-soluble NSF attachment protein [Tanacetum coccineum]
MMLCLTRMILLSLAAYSAFKFVHKHMRKAKPLQEYNPREACQQMESSAAALAMELSIWNEVADFYKRAAELYNECGRSQPASDALAKGARIDTFMSSDQGHCASQLLSAYREADVEEVKRIIRIARKLPTGELVAMEVNSLEHGEPLDEDDLT